MGTNTNPETEDSKLILDSIRMVVRALRISSKQCESDANLNGAQIFLLRQLSAQGGLCINDLAARTYTHQSTVSGLVSRLVEQGYIGRAPAKADGRKLELQLTTLGSRRLKAAPVTAQEKLARAAQEMPAPDRRSLALLLGALVQNAGLAQNNPPLFFED